MRHAHLELELLRRVVVRAPDPVVHDEATQQIDARLRGGSSDHDPAAGMRWDHESGKWSQIPGRWSPLARAADAQAASSSCRVPHPQPARVLRVQRTNIQKHHWTINRASKRNRRHRNLGRLHRQAHTRRTRVLRPSQRPRAATPASDERCRHDQRKSCCSKRPTQSEADPTSTWSDGQCSGVIPEHWPSRASRHVGCWATSPSPVVSWLAARGTTAAEGRGWLVQPSDCDPRSPTPSSVTDRLAQGSFQNTGPPQRAITWPLRAAQHAEPASLVADDGRADRVRLHLFIPRVRLGGLGPELVGVAIAVPLVLFRLRRS